MPIHKPLQPHRRLNPLTGEWLLVSPQRAERPWQGQAETPPSIQQPAYDPHCYLCPGNQRAGANQNPSYAGPYIFDNDFSALLPGMAKAQDENHPLLQVKKVKGICRVICFSSRHDLTLPELSIKEIRAVIDAWAAQAAELGRRYAWVQVFENKGEVMGCSNPHPHGQIWACDPLPEIAQRENSRQRIYFLRQCRPLLLDYAELEVHEAERVVVENKDWIAVVPFWAVWPYEILLLPRRQVLRLPDLGEQERENLAGILKRLLTRYDNLFQTPFPYSMGWHGAPFFKKPYGHWQLHAHFYPPLLRSAQVKKFMVGYEMTAEAQRDLTPEEAAGSLRAQSEIHYKKGG